jgi:hypothetical protein
MAACCEPASDLQVQLRDCCSHFTASTTLPPLPACCNVGTMDSSLPCSSIGSPPGASSSCLGWCALVLEPELHLLMLQSQFQAQQRCRIRTQHTTMLEEVCIALYLYKKNYPQTLQELMEWLEENHQVTISHATISTTLKWSAELLAKTDDANLSAKRQWIVKYSMMESTLTNGFKAN